MLKPVLFKKINISICSKVINRLNPIIGIYKITSPIGKIYIGKAVDIENRMSYYKGMYCENQIKVHRSLKKYGVQNHRFEIIHLSEIHELNDLEIMYIKLYDCFNNNSGLNLTSGGDSPKLSYESSKRIGDAHIKLYLSYNECKNWIVNNKINESIKTQTKWYNSTNSLPDFIPKDPQGYYIRRGDWNGWGDFLGTGVTANQKRKYYNYKECKEWIYKNELTKNIKTQVEWYKITKKLPYFIPKDPPTHYTKECVWVSWGDFLGTGRIANQKKKIEK